MRGLCGELKREGKCKGTRKTCSMACDELVRLKRIKRTLLKKEGYRQNNLKEKRMCSRLKKK